MTKLSFKIMRYNFFVNAFIPFVTTPAGILRYGLSATQVSSLNAFLIDWNLKFAAYVNPVTNSHVTVDAINAAYIEGFALTQSVRATIKNDTTITLTSEERAICNIKRPDSNPTPSRVPTFAPSITCIMQTSLMMNLVAINPELPFKRAKPSGIASIGFKIAIVDAGSRPPALTDYVRQEDETNTEFEMLFTDAQVGKVVYIIGFYINSRNQAGPDGIPCVVNII